MAAGFKTATVRSGDVAATLTNYPTYVDLSRLGITTLAEAESVRVYADSGKTTEWAREIVSVTQMHVKVPSLTSSTEIFVDWDGVRADYAVGATYGRNAVWTFYDFVSHDGGGTDSTAGITGTSFGGVTVGGVAGKLGDATVYDGSNDYVQFGNILNLGVASNTLSLSYWYKDQTGNDKAVIAKTNGGGPTANYGYQQRWALGEPDIYGADGGSFVNNDGSGVFANPAGVFAFLNLHYRANTTSVAFNGFYDNVGAVKNAGRGGTYSTDNSNTLAFTIGAESDAGTPCGITICEIRIKINSVIIPTTWWTTEYNNQNAESTFWGTWTTVGGGAAQTARRGVIMMM